MTTRVRHWILALSGGVLALGLAFWAHAGASSLFSRWRLVYGEPTVLYIASRFASGLPVYKPIDEYPFVAPIYTPLWLWLNALAIRIFGIAFWPGRVVALAATVTIAGLVATLVRQLGGTRLPAVVAAGLFLLLPPVAYVAPLNRVDQLAVLLTVAGFLAFLRQRTWWAVAFFGLSLATKQSMVAAPAAASLWALVTGDWRTVRRFAAAGVAAAGVLVGLDWAMQHALYLHHVAYLQLPLWAWGSFSIVDLLARVDTPAAQAALLVGLAVFVVLARGRARVMPLALYGALSLAFAVHATRRVGAWGAYFLEPCAPLSALVGLSVALQKGWPGVVVATALAVLSWLVVFSPPAPWHGGRGYTVGPLGVGYVRTPVDPGDDALSLRLLEAIRDTPGDVISAREDVILLAGKQVVFEPWFFNQLARVGAWDARLLEDRLAAGTIALVVLEGPATGLGAGFLFPPSILQAVRDHYALTERIGGYHLYRPLRAIDPS